MFSLYKLGFYLTKRHKDKLYPMVSWYTNTAKKVLAWVYSLKNCFKLERKYQRYLDSITV